MMIALIRGIVRFCNTDSLVVETGGIGYLVYAPRQVLSTLGQVGDEVELHTMLVVREDSLTLYGFEQIHQRTLFEILLGVSGVGPKVALSLLSSLAPDELRVVVAQKDATRLAKVPGIGKKMAERLLLELKGKLDLKGIPTTAASNASPEHLSLNNELIDLLVNLGYSSSEANAAVATLPADAPMDLEERLRMVLQSFGSA